MALQNALGDLALDATLASLNGKVTTDNTIPNTDESGQIVRQAPADLFRCSFASVGAGILTSDLLLMQTGAGMAVNQSAGNLVITSGTTANSETLIRSARTFHGAFTMRHKIILSQRIANNNFSVELADLIGTGLAFSITNATTVVVTFPTGTNPFTSQNVGQFMHISMVSGAAGIPGRFAIASVSGDSVTYTVAGWPASGSGTLTIWGWSYFRTLYTGTTVTNANVDAQRRGWATGDTVLTINTTASPGHVMQTQTDGNVVGYSDGLVATNAAYQFTARGSRIENIPDPNDNLYLFIRVLNGTSAPASTTTMTVGFVAVENHGNNKVYISGAAQSNASFAMASQIVNTPAVTISGTPTVTANQGTLLAGTVTNAIINSAASTNGTVLKATAGTVYSVAVSNINAAVRYLKLYNSTTVTVGTTTPALTIPIPAGGVVNLNLGAIGQRFSTGICIGITPGAADNDTAAVAANEIKVMVSYI
jgi:hypothetical protein